MDETIDRDRHGNAVPRATDTVTRTLPPGDDEPAPGFSEIEYDLQRERAKIRERVRRFVKTIEDIRDQELSDQGRTMSSIDTMIRHRSLSAYRLFAFRLVALLPILVIIAGLAGTVGHHAFGLPEAWSVAGSPGVFKWLSIAAIVGGLGWALIALRLDFDRYNLATIEQTTKIGQRITEKLRVLGQTFSAAQNAFTPIVGSNDAKEPVQRAIIDMFTAWRELERLPIYLRHDFSEYFSEAGDETNFGRPRNVRIVLAILFIVLSVVITTLSIWSLKVTADQQVLWPTRAVVLSFSALVMFLGLSVFWRRGQSLSGIHVLTLVVAVAGLATLAVAFWQWTVGTVFIDPQAKSFLAWNAMATSVISALAAMVAGELYKRKAKKLKIDLILELKTHKKDYAVEQFKKRPLFKKPKGDFGAWLKATKSTDGTWDGWTPTYEAERRAALHEQGLSEEEIDIEMGVDPKVYVGNEENRRLQAAGTDLVGTFYKVLPQRRQ